VVDNTNEKNVPVDFITQYTQNRSGCFQVNDVWDCLFLFPCDQLPVAFMLWSFSQSTVSFFFFSKFLENRKYSKEHKTSQSLIFVASFLISKALQ